MKLKIVNVPSIKHPITASPGFAKKQLSDFKLDLLALCEFGCRYCYAHNTALGHAAGITDEEIIEISSDDFLQSATPTEAEKLAVRWAEAVTLNKAAGDDALFAEMGRHFTEAEIVELTMVSAMFNMINRLNDSLQVPIEGVDEIGQIKRSLNMDPAKIQAYVSWVAENWPEDFSGLNEAAENAATWPATAAE